MNIYEILLQKKNNWWEKQIAIVYAENVSQAEQLAIAGKEDNFYVDGSHQLILETPRVLDYIRLGD